MLYITSHLLAGIQFSEDNNNYWLSCRFCFLSVNISCACQHTHTRTLIPIHNLAFLCMLHNSEWEQFLLSAHIVVNQGFIVAAAAQSLQRQNKAFIAFVRSPLPVKMFHSLAFTSTSCSSLSLCLCLIEIIFSKCLRCPPATEHLSWS